MADPQNPNQNPSQPTPWVQGKNPDGTPMVDNDGHPVDSNGKRDPGAASRHQTFKRPER